MMNIKRSLATVAALVATAIAVVATAAPAAPSQVLYAADWSSGLNGWAGGPSWKTLRGTLVSDGSDDEPILSPYDTAQLSDYLVEARIRMTRGPDIIPAAYGLTARRAADGGGYSGTVRHGYPAGIRYADGSWLVSGQPFVPDGGWHTYALQADGNVTTFLIDGGRIATVADNRYLTGGLTGLFSNNYQLEVATYRVLRLR